MSSLSAQMWHSIVTLPEQLLTALKQLLYFCFGYQWLVCNYRYFSFIHICHRSTTEWGMPSFMLQLWSRRLTPSCRSQESYSAASDLFLCPLLTSSSGEQEVHPGDCWHLSLIIGLSVPVLQLNYLKLIGDKGESTWRAGHWPGQRAYSVIPIKDERRRERRGQR